MATNDRVGAIDCGTNSIRLLIADVAAGSDRPRLTDLHREMRIVRLGQGVDATGELNPEAIERTRVALHDYVDLMRDAGVQHRPKHSTPVVWHSPMDGTAPMRIIAHVEG